MAKYKSEVVLTCNGKKVEDVLKTLRQMAADVKKEMDSLDPNIDATKIEALKKKFDLLNSAEASTIEANERLQHAIDNLATTSLQNLKKALGDGRRELQGLSEAQLAEADAIRKKMKIIGDEVRLLEGQYVKIEEGLKDINNQSNQWLDKAIKQQTELVNSLKKTDAEYAKQVQRLKQLRDEETRRAEVERAAEQKRSANALKKQAREAERRANTGDYAGLSQNEIEAGKKAMVDYQKTLEFGSKRWQEYGAAIGRAEEKLNSFKQKQESMTVQQARDLITNKDATSSQLREARSTIATARDNTPTSNTKQITEFDKMLQQIDDRLDAVNGKVKKTEISWQQMRKVMADPKGAIGEDIKRTMDAIQERIKKLPAGSQAVVNLRAEYAKLEKVLKGVEGELVDVNDVIRRSKSGKASIEELKKAYKQLEDELNKINTADPAFKNKQKDLKALKKQIDEVTGAANKQSSSWSTAAKNLVAYVGLFGAFNTLKSKLTEVLNLNFKYSDSLANIRKVSNMSMKSVNELSNQLAKLDTRTSLEGLTQLAYMGSRLGMSKYGVQGLADFAKAADRVGVALKEDLGDDAMLILSKLVETMGDVERHGGNISDAFDAVSSSIFKLASSSTSNGATIVEFAKRLTGLAKVTHVTTEQLLALGSASDSLMLMPEVSSTAFNKFISSLWDNYRNIEDMLGMQRDSLKKDIQEGQTMTALIKVLKSISEENLNSLDGMFKEFGSEGSRLKQVIVAMAQNVGVLEDHLKTSTNAYKEAIAVTQEYKIQQQTAQAVLERANNMWEKAFVNPQGIDAVKEMAKLWYDFSKALTQSETFLGTVKGLLWSLQFSVKALLAVMPPLIAYFGTKGLTTALGKLPALIAMLTGSGLAKYFTMLIGLLTRFSVTVRAVSIAWHGMNLAMRANLLGAIATTVTIVVTGLVKLYGVLNKTTTAYTKLSNSVGEANKHYLIEQRALANSANAILRAKKGTQERTAAIQNFNKAYGPYLSKLLTEANATQNVAKAYREAAAAIREKTYAEMRQKDYDKNVRPRLEREVTAQNELNEFAQTTKNSRLRFANGDWAVGIAQQNKDHEEAYQQALARMRRSGAKITDDQAAYIWGRRSSGLTDEGHEKNIHVFSNKSKSYEWNTLNDDMRQLHMVAQTIERNFATRYFDRKQNEIWGKKGLKDSEPVTETIKLKDPTENTKTKTGKTNNELNMAKSEANALLANIQAFYEEQRRKFFEWVSQMNESGEKVSEGYVKAFLSKLQEHEETATGLARQSIATAGKEWDDFHKQITDDQFQTATETDKRLLTAIDKANVQELHKLFEKLGQNLAKENHKTLAENLGALLDEIFKNGSRDLKKAAEEIMKRQYELQRMLAEMDYVGTVQREARSSWDENQLLPAAKGVDTNTEEGQAQMAASFEALTKKIRENLLALSEFDVRTKEGRDAFVAYLSDDEIKKGFDFQKLSILQIQALWMELYKYPDKYTEAEKRSYDLAKKLIEHRWKMNGMSKDQESRQSLADQKKRMYPDQHGFGSRLGFADQKYDPEVEGYKLKLQFAQEYYDFVLTHSKNAQLQQEAQMSLLQAQNDLVEGMVKAMQERMDKVKDFAQPIVDFGSAAGEALAQFRDDVESAQEALKQAAKSMLKSWGEMMINDLTAQTMQGMKNGMAVKVVKGSPTANTTAEKAVEGAKSGANELNDQAIADMQVAIQEGKYAKVYEIEVAYQEKSLEQWKAYADFKSRILGEDLASSPNDTPLMLRKQEESDAMLAQEQAQIDASLDLQKVKQTAINKAIEQGGKMQIKVQDKTNKTIAKNEAKAQNDMLSDTKETEEQKSDIIDVSGQAQVATSQFVNSKVLSTQKATNEERVQEDAATTQKETTLSIVEAMAKCFAFLGPIAGPITAGVIQALLMGLLNWALSSAFGSKKSGKSSNDKGPNTKLVTGMLTYDEGNVSDMQPYVGDNGNVYWATEDNSRHTGVNLLTRPTATTINGQPSLVAENGPELVIGRETTKAMMMNHPALMKALFSLDSRHSGRRTFDEGNVGEAIGGAPDASAAGNAAHDAQMMVLMSAILDRLNNPVPPEINMYGEGGLHHRLQQANQFMKGK